VNTETTFISSNKLAIIHVLAALIHNPLLFADSNYNFSIDDFPEQFHQIIFGAIEHLAKNGMAKIDYIDIDQFLKQYTVQYEVFSNNRGIEYIQNALAMFDEAKFEYYYHTLKKHSLINKLNSLGFDTRDIYDPDLTDPVANAKMCEKFDNMKENDILLNYETKLILAKEEFGSNSDRVENHAGDGLKELKERLKQVPDIGAPLMSPKLTTIYRGQRRGCLFLESAQSGFGKTRRACGEACHLAIPEFYDTVQKKWINTGMTESVLIINTELEEKECQTMWMAYIAGVPEDHIKDGRYLPGEEERVDKAIELIEKSNLRFVSVTNFDTDDIIDIIKKHKQLYDVNYVFFDYLGENLKITASVSRQAKVAGLRTDQILLMMAASLKDTAKTLGIYIWTASQLSGDYKNAKELDAGYLRSAKSIADKVDVGTITMPIREQDNEVINAYCAKGFELSPNAVISVYKVRAGSYNNIKVYVYFDKSTCQMHDCFVTNAQNEILPVADTNIEMILDDTKEKDFKAAYAGQEAASDIDFDF
jgi:replicative DNA helicase